MTNSFGLLKLLIVITLIFSSTYSMGQYLEPTTKTNINQIDPLFEENIENYQGWQEAIDRKRETAIEASGNNQAFGEESSTPKAKSEIDRLSNISANELEGQGRQERAAKPWVDDFFVDYSKAGGRQHQSDAELIANSSGKLMNKLTSLLKDLGVDCQEVKGNKEVEPQYYLELRRKKMRDDTVYDQFFCEQLRNHYVCHDRLMLSCKTRGVQKGKVQPKVVNIGAMDLWSLGVLSGEDYEQWGNTYEDAKLVLKIRLDARSIPVIKSWLALKEGVKSDFIDNIRVSYSSGIMFMNLDSRKHGFTTYRLDYDVAEKHEVCLEWNEEWNEVCELN